MKQLTFIKKNTLEWWDVKPPKLESEGDAIIRPLAAARCDADKAFLFHDASRLLRMGLAVHYIDPETQRIFGEKPFKGPFPIGHECVGEVAEVGPSVSRFKRGDKVIVPWAISCGGCSHCLSGLTSKCKEAGETMFSAYGFGEAMGPFGGMISDTIRVPFADHMLVKVPQGIDHVSLASASDNIPDGWRTVGPQLKNRPGAPVLVLGGSAASVGLYAAGIAVALGSEQVDYLDYDEERLKIAVELGANAIRISKKERKRWYKKHLPELGTKYPIVADCAMNPDALRFGIRCLAPGGICTSVGFYFQKGVSLPMMQMYGNDSTFHTGISHSRATLPDVMDLIKSGKFQPQKITTCLAKWEDAHEAYLEQTTKVVLKREAIF